VQNWKNRFRWSWYAICAVGLACSSVEAPQVAFDEPTVEEVGAVKQRLEAGVAARVTGDPGGNPDSIQIVTRDGRLPSGTVTGKYIEEGRSYQIVENDKDQYRPNIRHAAPGHLLVSNPAERASECLGSHGNCLVFRGYGTPTDFTFTDKSGWSNDRLELVLSRGSQDGGFSVPELPLKFGQKRYLRFYIRPAADFESPTSPDDSIIVSQVWQISQTTSGLYPPILVVLKAGPTPSQLNLVFEYSNASVQRGVLATTTINKGSWNNFHIMLIPQWQGASAGLGGVLIWKNLGLNPTFIDTQALNYSTRNVAYGYRPATADHNDDASVIDTPANTDADDLTCLNDAMSNCFDIRVGIYRDVYHNYRPSLHQTVYFDSIKITNNEASMNGF
jgi:hypothetical protein